MMNRGNNDNLPDGRMRSRQAAEVRSDHNQNGNGYNWTTPPPGVDTEPPEPIPAPEQPTARPVRKVGFIVNDTIESAIKQSHDTARFLTSRDVLVVESHSASP